jgi:hypothetical protein
MLRLFAEQKIIHLDLHADNVLLSTFVGTSPTAYIIDFGRTIDFTIPDQEIVTIFDNINEGYGRRFGRKAMFPDGAELQDHLLTMSETYRRAFVAMYFAIKSIKNDTSGAISQEEKDRQIKEIVAQGGTMVEGILLTIKMVDTGNMIFYYHREEPQTGLYYEFIQQQSALAGVNMYEEIFKKYILSIEGSGLKDDDSVETIRNEIKRLGLLRSASDRKIDDYIATNRVTLRSLRFEEYLRNGTIERVSIIENPSLFESSTMLPSKRTKLGGSNKKTRRASHTIKMKRNTKHYLSRKN